MTIKKLIEKGTLLEHYPCDINEFNEIESNGSIEEIWLFQSKIYFINRTWEGIYFGKINSCKKKIR